MMSKDVTLVGSITRDLCCARAQMVQGVTFLQLSRFEIPRISKPES